MKRLFIALSTTACWLFAITIAFGETSANEPPPQQVNGTVTGPTAVCIGSTGTYTVNGSSATNGYTWSPPNGVQINSGQGTKTINVTFVSGGKGQFMSVSGNSLYVPFTVDIYLTPSGSGSLVGPASVCPGQTGAQYTISGLSNIEEYSWFAPSGATIVEPAGTRTSTITVNFSTGFTGGTLGITGIGGPCNPTQTYYMTVNPGEALPQTPGTITGPQSAAKGQNNVSYSVATVTNATSYEWTLPTGANISSSSNSNSVTVNFTNSFNGGNLSVKGKNGTCTGPSSLLLPINTAEMPAAAGPISGNPSFCMGSTDVTFLYSVSPITNAIRYQWTYGPGIIPLGDPDHAQPGYPFSNRMNIQFQAVANLSTTWLSVQGVNEYGNGISSTITISIYKPVSAAGSITGSQAVCPGQTNVGYSVPVITNANPYTWELPAGASLNPGSNMNSNSIQVTFPSGFTSGNITVFGSNGPCGSGASSTIPVSIFPLPGAAGAIAESTTACPNKTGVVYSVAAAGGATPITYEWTVPPSATIVGGFQTNSITVNYSGASSSGNVSVYRKNCSGNGSTTTQSVTLTPLPEAPGAIMGSSDVCPGGSEINSINAVASADAYVWTVPPGATISAGQNTVSIVVNYSVDASAGNVTVYGANCSGNGPVSTLPVGIKPKPGPAGQVFGTNLICPGETGITYNVTIVRLKF